MPVYYIKGSFGQCSLGDWSRALGCDVTPKPRPFWMMSHPTNALISCRNNEAVNSNDTLSAAPWSAAEPIVIMLLRNLDPLKWCNGKLMPFVLVATVMTGVAAGQKVAFRTFDSSHMI